MFKKYGEILSIPGALRFSVAGVLARFPMALVGISTILMIKTLYGNYALAGLVSGIGTVAFAIGAPMLARMVDAYGQARVMIPALIISCTSMIAMVLCAINHAPAVILLVLNAISGATSGSIGALVRARWAYVTSVPSQIQAAYSLESALDELVFVIGPVLATLIATTIHPTGGLWLAMALIVSGGLWFLSQKSTEPPARGKVKTDVRQRSVMLNPAMLVLAATYMGAGAMFGANDLSVVAFAEERGAASLAGVLLAVFSFGSLMGALVYGARTWRWPLWKLFAVGIVALAIGASTFAFATSLSMLAIIMVLTGLTIAPTMTNVNTIVQRIMPETRLTEGLTWMSTAMNIGVSVGSGLTGPAIDNGGAHNGFMMVIACAWLMVVAMLLGLRFLKRETTNAAETRAEIIAGRIPGEEGVTKTEPPISTGERNFKTGNK